MADIIGAPGAIAEQAFCLGDDIAVYVQNSTGMHIHVLGIDQMNVTLRKSWAVPSEVGCLSQFRLGGEQFVFVGSISMDGKGTVPFVYDLDGNLVMTGPSSSSEMGKLQHASSATRSLFSLSNESRLVTEERDEILDTFNSVCVVREKADSVNIVAGTRLGKLLTIEISQTAPRRIYVTSERIGSASVDVFAAPGRPGEEPSAFATCDNMLLRLSNFADRRNIYTRKDTVWATDASDLSLCSPPIHGVCTIAPRTEDLGSRALVLLLSKTSLYVADVEPRAGPVPRTISPGWGGTPTRVIFSKCWNCLVVALQVEKGIDLALVNPDTGHLMSKPLRKDRGEAELQSFNTKGDRILGLYEWVYVKDGRTFPFVVVTTQSGKLLVVSVAKSKAPGRDRYLEHWTRYRKKAHDHAVCAVTADEKGLLYASGRAVYHEILDLEEKRMKTVKTHVLESPVISLEVVDGRLHVLTAMHSVEVVDYTTNEFSREMTHLYSDRSARAATHMIKLEHSGDKGLWPVTLVSDMTGGITGLWAPPSGRNAQELVTVFQGKLRNSVRRFARGLCRPPWQVEAQRRLRFGTLSSTMDGAEVLGVSLDGTLRHFRLLSIDLWRYLALVQALSQRGRAWYGRSNSGMLEPDVDPKNMHIQGDAICHVLENRLLEELVAQADCMLLFCQLLHKLDSNGLPQKYYGNGFQNDRGASDALFEWLDQSIKLTEEERAKYFDVGYEVLGYVLTPAV